MDQKINVHHYAQHVINVFMHIKNYRGQVEA